MGVKHLKNALKQISDEMETRQFDFNTAVTYYQIKSGCNRETAIKIVKRSMKIQEQIKKVLPKLEFVNRFYLKLMEGEELSEAERIEYELLIKDFEEIFENQNFGR